MDYTVGDQVGIAISLAILFCALGTGVAAICFGVACRKGLQTTQNLRLPVSISTGVAWLLFSGIAIATSHLAVATAVGMLAMPAACYCYLHFAPQVMEWYVRQWFDAIEEYADRGADILRFADADQDGVVCRHDFTTSEQALLAKGISTNLIKKMKEHFSYFGHQLSNEGTTIISPSDPAAARTRFRSDYVGWIADYEGWSERYKRKA